MNKMKSLAIIALTSGMVITGCTSTGGIQTNDSASRVGLGALAGALAGVAISQATGGEQTGRDAAIGAVLGMGVATYMSNQEAKLKQQTAGTGIKVALDPKTNNINLAIPEAITFNVGQYNIKPSSYHVLNQVADTLNEYHQTYVLVNGYASVEGDEYANKILSQDRAAAVATYLSSQGVSNARISIIGHGETTKFGSRYEPNRRVELTIIAPKM